MGKLTIKDVVKFRSDSDRGKKNFAIELNLNKEKQKPEVGGGDYWVSCISALCKCYKLDDAQPISDRINELQEKYECAEYKRTKLMYKRNIDVLHKFETADLGKWRPSDEIKILKQHKLAQILHIHGLQIQANPNYVFSFDNNGYREIGAIWFIAKLDGFKSEDLGMFADAQYRYLDANFLNSGKINPEYCIVVDLYTGVNITYSQLGEGGISKILNKTIDEIKRLM